MLFKDYELLSQSGLFDPAYYLAANPEVAALGVDPLMHYLETGAAEGRAPSEGFDPAFYLEQCRQIGETPENALLHYLTVGAAQGLKAKAGKAGGRRIRDRYIHIDTPRLVDDEVQEPVLGSLALHGWVLSSDGVESIEIFVDGEAVGAAHHGMRRPDVAALVPEREDALGSGFAFLVPHWKLAAGQHTLRITLRDRNGVEEVKEFRLRVADAQQSEGARGICRRMTRGEMDLRLRILQGLEWQPRFQVVLHLDDDAMGIDRAQRSLASLAEQAYPRWRVLVINRRGKLSAQALRKRLAGSLGDWRERLDVGAGERDSAHDFVCLLAAGDELGCDALLEYALASGFRRGADFLYADEHCLNPASKRAEAYFKPQWSPDLLLSTNYIGRHWCADAGLPALAGRDPGTWLAQGEYDLVLRLTEQAKDILHVPRVLGQRGEGAAEEGESERAALAAAAKRRGIAATLEPGCGPGFHRLKRKVPTRARVSIIIPTCAAQDRIKACLGTLRDITVLRGYEVVCIENIAAENRAAKQWLRCNADRVIETAEPFNWSRYNNLAAEQAGGEYLLFLNDDVEIIEPHWLEALLEHAARPEVGVVGPQLLYADRSVQHAGLALTHTMGRARHLFRHARLDDPGYFGLALSQRNVIGVTGACLLTRAATWRQLGRFDEGHGIINNDVDYCLRAWSAGLLNIYTPYARLIHHELVSRWNKGEAYDDTGFAARWGRLFAQGDPYLNPALSREHDNMQPEQEPLRLVCAARPLMAATEVRRILIVKLDHIGDCVTALPALGRLMQRFPEAKFSVLAAPSTRAIWEMNPRVEEFIPFEFFHERSGLGRREVSEEDLAQLGRLLAPRRYDLAVDLRKSADTRPVLRHTGARFLAGFEHGAQFPWLDIGLEWEGDPRYYPKRQRVGDDLLNLADAVALACEADAPVIRPPVAEPDPAHAALLRKPVVCIHPAAGNDMRQWPQDYFAELIDLITEDQGLHVALIGSAAEAAAAQALRSKVKHKRRVFSLAGEVPLAELPALLARCSLFVGNNSGPHHLAAAVGIPTVGIYSGVVDPREWGGAGRDSVILRRAVSCSPCYLEKWEDCTRGMACLTGVRPWEVYQICRGMLGLRRVGVG